MIALPSLYDHQTDQKDRGRAALARHCRVIWSAPPGTGKTRMAKWVFASSANRTPADGQSGRSLFGVYSRGLVDNAIKEFKKEPSLPHGVIMSDRDTSYGLRTQVASIDSLLGWFIEDGRYKPDLTFDLLVFDETDSHLPKFAKFYRHHEDKRAAMGLRPAYLLGLTATPQATGLGDLYNDIVPGPPTKWLINNGFLSPFRYFRATEGQLDKLVLRGGEFTQKSHADAMSGLSGALVRDWRKFAEGLPTVGFFRRRSEAKQAMAEFRADGLEVEYVDAYTHDDERNNIFRALDEHSIDYICNVQLIQRGTDIPRIGCLQMCVAMASRKAWYQKLGRGSRLHPEKTDCVVLDHGGNINRKLGLFEDDPQWTLDITTKDPGEVAARPTIECPKCQAMYRGGLCANCGYEPTQRERRGQGLDFDGSELKEVTRQEKKSSKRTPEALMVSALYEAGRSTASWRGAYKIFKRLCEEQGTSHYIPRTVTVGGHRYNMLRYGSEDAGRRISTLYPFTNGGGHGGEYLVEEQETTGAPY